MSSNRSVVGDYGRGDLPIRPELRHVPTAGGGGVLDYPRVCPQGHLGAGQVWVGWHAVYRLPHLTCRACFDRGDRARSEWCLIDPHRQVTSEQADPLGVQIVVIPPLVWAGTGRIEVRFDGRVVTDLDVTLCGGECQRGVIEHVRTDQSYRRRGFGWTAVAAALTRGPGYAWSTTTVTDPGAGAFWTAIGFAEAHTLGQPEHCAHMRRAWEQMP